MGYDTPIGRFGANWSKGTALAAVWASYLVAGIAGVAVAFVVGEFEGLKDAEILKFAGLIQATAGDFVATTVVWFAGILFNNSSLYDPYWSVFTPVAYCFWVAMAQQANRDVPLERTVLVGISCWFWAIRLTTNWMRDWRGLSSEDFRYILIRETFQKNGYPKSLYWFVGSFSAVMVFPTVQVLLGSIAAFVAVSFGVESDNANGFNFVDILATLLCVSAATIQFIADEQMRKFRNAGHPREKVMESGLWYYSRHPNYFGELLFWFGIYVHALATDPLKFWWTGIGFVAMLLLFVFASVPLMEKRQLKRRPEFARIMATTSMLVPMWRKKNELLDPIMVQADQQHDQVREASAR